MFQLSWDLEGCSSEISKFPLYLVLTAQCWPLVKVPGSLCCYPTVLENLLKCGRTIIVGLQKLSASKLFQR